MSEATARRGLYVLISATLIVVISWGTRQSFGLFLRPISVDMGWGREIVSIAIATQHLLVGLAVPFAGALADRWGTGRVLAGGGMLLTAGVLLMSQATTPTGMLVGAGFLAGIGLSGCGLPLIISVVGRIAPEEKRSTWLGLATAGATAGQFLVVPSSQVLLEFYGWSDGLLILSAVAAGILVLAIPVARADRSRRPEAREQNLSDALREAAGHRGYWLLTAGFFVCGFQVQFIASHIPAYLVDVGVPAALGAAVIAVIGIFNMIGAWVAGVLGTRRCKKNLLSIMYAARALVIAVFVMAPKTEVTVLAFAAIIGLLWLGTVPLTSGIVAQVFGTRYMATLYGIVYMSHQLGSFSGVWLGGRLFDATGSYDVVWWVTIGLGVFAALVHLPIDERPIDRGVDPRATVT